MKAIYYVVMTLPITVDGKKYRTNIKSDDYLTPEQARDYAELFLEVGIAIAYRVIVDRDNRRIHLHEYAHYLTEEQVALPPLPDPQIRELIQDPILPPKPNPFPKTTYPSQDPIFPRNIKGGPLRVSDPSRHTWDPNWPKPSEGFTEDPTKR